MSKRTPTTDIENKSSLKKKSKREISESKWRSNFLNYKNQRIKLAVAASVCDELPIILIKDTPSYLATYYTFFPKNQDIGERVLNLLECLYSYGHVEDNDDEKSKGYLASQDHIYIIEALCHSELDSNEIDLIDYYFETTVDQIGVVRKIEDFSKLPPLLYTQPCYGYL